MKKEPKLGEVVQMPLRCTADLEERIIRALGVSMSKSGKKISKNDFLIRLLEEGLKSPDLNT